MKSQTFKGAFVLATYQRPEILSKVLQAIYGADNSSIYNKVIIFQGNDEKSLEIINHFKDEATILVRVSGKDKSPLENITNNYLMGLEIAFEYLAVDYVIEVEDDSVIAPHTLEFIDQIFEKYKSNRKFRGINLGSYENRQELIGTYSLLRTGFHATHGVIVKRSWKYISRRRITTRIRTSPLDSTVEPYWKTGFSVTPNLSLCENFGWLNGTHASNDSKDIHYKSISASFQAQTRPKKWNELTIEHTWNPNPRKYRWVDNWKFQIYYLMDVVKKTHTGIKIGESIKVTKSSLKQRLLKK
jgi:hypothetical protein